MKEILFASLFLPNRYENPGIFTPLQLNTIKKITLAKGYLINVNAIIFLQLAFAFVHKYKSSVMILVLCNNGDEIDRIQVYCGNTKMCTIQ